MSSGEEIRASLRVFDGAVVDCDGCPGGAAQDPAELVRLLTERNREIVEDGRPYDLFGGLGGTVGDET